MDNATFNDTMETRIGELVDLYAKKFIEVNGGDAVLVDPTDIWSVATALGGGDPEVSADMVDHLDRATTFVQAGGVEQDLNTVKGRAEDWVGKTGDAFYLYLGEAEKSIANQIDLLQALTLIQRSQEAAINSSRDDAVAILPTSTRTATWSFPPDHEERASAPPAARSAHWPAYASRGCSATRVRNRRPSGCRCG